jgi:hypothetical protein
MNTWYIRICEEWFFDSVTCVPILGHCTLQGTDVVAVMDMFPVMWSSVPRLEQVCILLSWGISFHAPRY